MIDKLIKLRDRIKKYNSNPSGDKDQTLIFLEELTKILIDENTPKDNRTKIDKWLKDCPKVTIEEWEKNHPFSAFDGSEHWANKTYYGGEAYGKPPVWATHVIFFGK